MGYYNDQLKEFGQTGDIDEKFIELADQGYWDYLHDLENGVNNAVIDKGGYSSGFVSDNSIYGGSKSCD